MKTCRVCRVSYPLDMFGPNRCKPGGLQNECRNCRRIEGNASYARRFGRVNVRLATREVILDLAQIYGCEKCREVSRNCLWFFHRGSMKPLNVSSTSAAYGVIPAMACLCKNCEAKARMREIKL